MASTAFKATLGVMMFYSLFISLMTWGLSTYMPGSIDYVTSFQDLGQTIDLNTTAQTIQSSLEQQTSIPVIELGALVFYSGNIFIDLLLNFAFAIPQMISLFLMGLSMLIPFPPFVIAAVQGFSSVLIGVIYLVTIIEQIIGIRSGRAIT